VEGSARRSEPQTPTVDEPDGSASRSATTSLAHPSGGPGPCAPGAVPAAWDGRRSRPVRARNTPRTDRQLTNVSRQFGPSLGQRRPTHAPYPDALVGPRPPSAVVGGTSTFRLRARCWSPRLSAASRRGRARWRATVDVVEAQERAALWYELVVQTELGHACVGRHDVAAGEASGEMDDAARFRNRFAAVLARVVVRHVPTRCLAGLVVSARANRSRQRAYRSRPAHRGLDRAAWCREPRST
jgi:hypothetical protein